MTEFQRQFRTQTFQTLFKNLPYLSVNDKIIIYEAYRRACGMSLLTDDMKAEINKTVNGVRDTLFTDAYVFDRMANTSASISAAKREQAFNNYCTVYYIISIILNLEIEYAAYIKGKTA